MKKICIHCGQEFDTCSSARKFCSTDCSNKYHNSRKRTAPQKPKKRESHIDEKLRCCGGKYADLQKAETIEMFARVVVEAS